MTPEQPSIARREFPTTRRGYDPAAVDAHLEAVEARVADLESRVAGAAPLSARAGEQVQAIVEAAERSAQEIRAAAEADARQRIGRAAEAADRLGARIDGMAADIGVLMSDLRSRAQRLREELAAIQEHATELSDSPAAPPPQPPSREEPSSVELAAGAEPDSASAPGSSNDAAAARIVALDMALSGTPREETERYLAEHYDVSDRDALLDDVYAAAGTT